MIGILFEAFNQIVIATIFPQGVIQRRVDPVFLNEGLCDSWREGYFSWAVEIDSEFAMKLVNGEKYLICNTFGFDDPLPKFSSNGSYDIYLSDEDNQSIILIISSETESTDIPILLSPHEITFNFISQYFKRFSYGRMRDNVVAAFNYEGELIEFEIRTRGTPYGYLSHHENDEAIPVFFIALNGDYWGNPFRNDWFHYIIRKVYQQCFLIKEIFDRQEI